MCPAGEPNEFGLGNRVLKNSDPCDKRGLMPDQVERILPYILVASGTGVVGGIVAVLWAPGVKARSAVQHFAAGIVMAAVASELIPEVEKKAGHSAFLAALRWED
jgi:hypothetical protein